MWQDRPQRDRRASSASSLTHGRVRGSERLRSFGGTNSSHSPFEYTSISIHYFPSYSSREERTGSRIERERPARPHLDSTSYSPTPATPRATLLPELLAPRAKRPAWYAWTREYPPRPDAVRPPMRRQARQSAGGGAPGGGAGRKAVGMKLEDMGRVRQW